MPKLIRQYITPAGVKEIDAWVAKYPKEEKQSAVMSALMVAQKEHGFLTKEVMDAVADYLDMAPIAVYEVASFYTMYEHQPIGRHLVNVCTNISCKLRNCDAIVSHLETKLDIKLGETTADGLYTLRQVECLGACVNAPMMQVNKDYHENLTPENVDAILARYR
ncbi:MAG: NADH-quinone oxidoreductase subunit NuoE [Legionellales bacterium]|nr:NADH-quinone oxidoreductase subunit NuoE [Legionellales bacterium]